MSDFLLAVHGVSGEGVLLLKKIFPKIEELSSGLRSSSVYRVRKIYKNSRHIHDIRTEESYDGLVAVLRGSTDLELGEFHSKLKEIENYFRSEALHRSADIKLLVYGDEVVLTPQVTVPNPEFHRNPEELVPASELWPSYRHPILSETLSTLARNHLGKEWGEFYSQGISPSEEMGT